MSSISRLAAPRPVELPPPVSQILRRGRCNHVELCERATTQRLVELPASEPFLCPDCGHDLIPATARAGARSNLVMAAQATAILLALGGAGYQMWTGLHQPAAPVPAGPVAMVATHPAPARAAIVPAVVPAPSTHRAPVVLRVAHQIAPPDPSASLSFPGPAPTLQATDAVFLATAHAPPPPDSTPIAETAAQRLADFLDGATRLPITIHFPPNTTQLDRLARRDVIRLATWLRTHHAAPDRLRIAGFTDAQGDAGDNAAMARRRVMAVADALARVGVKTGRIGSFGDDDPIADNATPAGRDKNRRVEAYIEE